MSKSGQGPLLLPKVHVDRGFHKNVSTLNVDNTSYIHVLEFTAVLLFRCIEVSAGCFL